MKVSNRFTLAFLAVLLPAAAFADVSGTLTLTASTNVSMDTGTVVGSGGDFSWNGTTLTPQGSAKALNATSLAGLSGATGYATLTETVIQSFASIGSSAPLTGLAANTVIGYETNGGNVGKLLVTSVTGGTLVFQYTTYISPTITGVLNNYSLISPGFAEFVKEIRAPVIASVAIPTL